MRIRIEGLAGEELAPLLERALALAGTEPEAGEVVSLATERIRVRRLPIGT